MAKKIAVGPLSFERVGDNVVVSLSVNGDPENMVAAIPYATWGAVVEAVKLDSPATPAQTTASESLNPKVM